MRRRFELRPSKKKRDEDDCIFRYNGDPRWGEDKGAREGDRGGGPTRKAHPQFQAPQPRFPASEGRDHREEDAEDRGVVRV